MGKLTSLVEQVQWWMSELQHVLNSSDEQSVFDVFYETCFKFFVNDKLFSL